MLEDGEALHARIMLKLIKQNVGVFPLIRAPREVFLAVTSPHTLHTGVSWHVLYRMEMTIYCSMSGIDPFLDHSTEHFEILSTMESYGSRDDV